MPISPVRLTVAATAAALVAFAPAAHAAPLYLTSGSYTANDLTYRDSVIHVGRDSSNNNGSGGVPYVATLNVVNGGNVSTIYNYNTSTVNISGGIVASSVRGSESSTTNITGGDVRRAEGINNITRISGGSVFDSFAYGTAAFHISGGTLTKGLFLSDTTATANFVGTGLSSAYSGYTSNNAAGAAADYFIISGTFGGVTRTYDLYIRNRTGTGDNTRRQFTIGTPEVVPESGTVALLLPALGVLGAVVAARRRK